MKNLLLVCLLITPLFVNANTLEFNATGNNFKFKGYDGDPVTQTGKRNVGQFGSFSISGNGGGKFSATYLGDESGFNNNYGQFINGSQIMDESILGSTVTANVFGSGLLNFGFASGVTGNYVGLFGNGEASSSILGFVVLKEYIGKNQSVAAAGYDNSTTSLGDFDFLLGFNDYYKQDADYDDYVVGIKYTPNAVPVPAALPLLASAIGLFGFAANRRRV